MMMVPCPTPPGWEGTLDCREGFCFSVHKYNTPISQSQTSRRPASQGIWPGGPADRRQHPPPTRNSINTKPRTNRFRFKSKRLAGYALDEHATSTCLGSRSALQRTPKARGRSSPTQSSSNSSTRAKSRVSGSAASGAWSRARARQVWTGDQTSWLSESAQWSSSSNAIRIRSGTCSGPRPRAR
jgi:hypothetical protein